MELYDEQEAAARSCAVSSEKGVYCEADFYYERDGLKGVAFFVDGPTHDEPAQKQKDSEQGNYLDDLGYRVLTIRYERSIGKRIGENPDVFGPGTKTVAAH